MSPENLWSQCAGCQQMIFTKELEKNLRVCPHCGHHFQMSARARRLYHLDDFVDDEDDVLNEAELPLLLLMERSRCMTDVGHKQLLQARRLYPERVSRPRIEPLLLPSPLPQTQVSTLPVFEL